MPTCLAASLACCLAVEWPNKPDEWSPKAIKQKVLLSKLSAVQKKEVPKKLYEDKGKVAVDQPLDDPIAEKLRIAR